VTVSPVERRERRRRRRRQELTRWGIRIGLVLIVFLLGIALGQALHDNPNPGSTITVQRTLSVPTTGNPASTVTP
jgi:cytochrome bd-type quinol oxidase subunit 2